MHREFSTPIEELPTFLSTISMVVDDQSMIVQKLREAERKAPPIYASTRDLFLTVLSGRLSFHDATVQARRIVDQTERRCAVQVIDASEQFLREERPAHIAPLQKLEYALPNGLILKVLPVWLREASPDRLLILHFWQTPLSQWQLGAAASVLRGAIASRYPQYSACEIDFISVAFSQMGQGRRFERYNWMRLKPLSISEIDRFWKQFLAGWSRYQRQGPREIARRWKGGLFD